MTNLGHDGDKESLYKAIIWLDDPDKPGQRVSVDAESLKAARAELEAEYGRGHVFDLYNEDEAARPR